MAQLEASLDFNPLNLISLHYGRWGGMSERTLTWAVNAPPTIIVRLGGHDNRIEQSLVQSNWIHIDDARLDSFVLRRVAVCICS